LPPAATAFRGRRPDGLRARGSGRRSRQAVEPGQLGNWLRDETGLSAAIHSLRAELLNSDDRRPKLIAENFIALGARVRASE